MIEFVLIVHIWTGMLSKYESQSMAVVEGFKTLAECQKAGEEAKKLATNVRDGKYVCVQRTR
jgi:hypothetical protein